jgi:hypothetical protein
MGGLRRRGARPQAHNALRCASASHRRAARARGTLLSRRAAGGERRLLTQRLLTHLQAPLDGVLLRGGHVVQHRHLPLQLFVHGFLCGRASVNVGLWTQCALALDASSSATRSASLRRRSSSDICRSCGGRRAGPKRQPPHARAGTRTTCGLMSLNSSGVIRRGPLPPPWAPVMEPVLAVRARSSASMRSTRGVGCGAATGDDCGVGSW